MRRLPPRLATAVSLLGPPVAVLVGGFALVLAISSDPLLAYQDLLFANFYSASNFALFVNRTTPLLFVGLSVILSFRAGVFNVGGEGQLYLGAIAATAAGLACGHAPQPLGLIAATAAGAAAGALWGWIPGQLKVKLGVNEVVSTLMLNFVAMLLTQYLVTHPLRDPKAYGAVSFMLAPSVWLPEIPGLPGATGAALIALALAPLAWLLLFRTTWGADLRAAGANPRFAEAVGIDADRRVLEAMALSGAVAGLSGALYVLGIGHRFEQNFSPGFGLIGLTVALLARLSPLGVVLTAAFYALVLNGAAYMQIDTDVPRSLVGLLTGFLVLFMTARGRAASAAA